MNPLPRRKLLTGGVALAAMAAPSLLNSARPNHSTEAAGTVVVRWNSSSKKWAPRPAKADFGVVFLSTNDPNATPPTDTMLQAGDVWRRHPDAEEAVEA